MTLTGPFSLLADLHPSCVFVWPFPSNRQFFFFSLHRTSYLSCLSMNEHCKKTCLPLLNCPVAIVALKFRSTHCLALLVPLDSERITSLCLDITTSKESSIAVSQCTITAVYTIYYSFYSFRANCGSVGIVMRCILRVSALKSLYRWLLPRSLKTPEVFQYRQHCVNAKPLPCCSIHLSVFGRQLVSPVNTTVEQRRCVPKCKARPLAG